MQHERNTQRLGLLGDEIVDRIAVAGKLALGTIAVRTRRIAAHQLESARVVRTMFSIALDAVIESKRVRAARRSSTCGACVRNSSSRPRLVSIVVSSCTTSTGIEAKRSSIWEKDRRMMGNRGLSGRLGPPPTTFISRIDAYSVHR